MNINNTLLNELKSCSWEFVSLSSDLDIFINANDDFKTRITKAEKIILDIFSKHGKKNCQILS